MNTHVLKPGMVQLMFFDLRLVDSGPLHMSVAERNDKKKVRAVKNLTEDLVENMTGNGVDDSVNEGREDVVMIC